MSIEKLKTELEHLTEEYRVQRNEPALSIFNVAPNSQLLQDFMKKADDAYKVALEENPELQDEMVNTSSEYIAKMTGIMLGGE